MEPQGPFCQSCATPLNQRNCCGTKKDGSRSEKYCFFCFKDGKFTLPNATLEEMIEISANGVDQIKIQIWTMNKQKNF